jgi:hypothetical protein
MGTEGFRFAGFGAGTILAFARSNGEWETRQMSFTTLIGAAIGSAIDGASGDDSSIDGAIEGAIAANVVKAVIPLALTFATGWLVLRGIGKVKDQVFGASARER